MGESEERGGSQGGFNEGESEERGGQKPMYKSKFLCTGGWGLGACCSRTKFRRHSELAPILSTFLQEMWRFASYLSRN